MYYGGLFVGEYQVSRLRDGVPDTLLAIFRKDMYQPVLLPTSDDWRGDLEPEERGEETLVRQLVAPGSAIVDRLEAVGCTLVEAMWHLQDSLESARGHIEQMLTDPSLADMRESLQSELAKFDGLDAAAWLAELGQRGLPDAELQRYRIGDAERESAWLLQHLDYWDERYALRLILEVFPQYDVQLDVTEMVEDGVFPEDIAEECSVAVANLRQVGSRYSPVVVLTEGRSDAAILERALKLLYPQLTDLVRFMDYSRKPEGGAGALVATVRAFASAGITNRLVALFDNDSAATDALTSLDLRALPSNVRVLQYPYLQYARQYPTIGPPAAAGEEPKVMLADVNGLAGSIELYLGKDVLMQDNGEFMPVQWRSYLPKVRHYQGAILDKSLVQERFDEKAGAVERGDVPLVEEDWAALRLILDAIRNEIRRFAAEAFAAEVKKG